MPIYKTIDDLNLMDAFNFLERWTPNSAVQFKITLGNKTIDEFLEKMAILLGGSWNKLNDKIKTLTVNGITITYNELSNSGFPTIDILINGKHFKIRF